MDGGGGGAIRTCHLSTHDPPRTPSTGLRHPQVPESDARSVDPPMCVCGGGRMRTQVCVCACARAREGVCECEGVCVSVCVRFTWLWMTKYE